MVYASQLSQLYRNAVGYGWKPVEPHFHWQKLVAAIDTETYRLSTLQTHSLEKAGAKLFRGRAVLQDAHTIVVGTQTFTAQKILFAVGSEAVLPVIPGAEYAVTSRHMFTLPTQPARLAIIGGGTSA